jgi:SAM-dependent methyltransferase
MPIPAHALTTEGGEICPVCESTTLPRIDVGDYQLFECMTCGCWSSDSLFRGAATSFVPQNYFSNANSDESKWDELWKRLDWKWGRTCTALDVGCGTGAYLAYLNSRVSAESRLEGIELEGERAAETRRRNPSLRVHEGDARTALVRVTRPIDLVTLWDVFEHVVDPRSLLKELAASLSKDGVIYLQTIHEHSILPRLGRLAYRLTAGGLRYPARRTHEAHHLVFFSQTGLETMAACAGLRIREVWFDRLARSRMDGNAFVTGATSTLLALENGLGNGLFINLILERDPNHASEKGA